MAKAAEPLTKDLRLGSGPFIFEGSPPRCVGEIVLINASAEPVKIRSITATRASEKGASSPVPMRLDIGAVLPPRESVRTQAYFEIDPLTPPGSYNVNLSIGDKTETGVVHVWEKANLAIGPRTVPIRGASGDVVTKSVVVTNNGNVTHTFPNAALVYLEEHEWLGRAQVRALRQTGKDDGMERFLDNLIKELKETMPDEARVALHYKAAELRPGETHEFEVEMTLPEGLRKGRTYKGFAKFMGDEIKFQVDCNGTSNSYLRRSQ